MTRTLLARLTEAATGALRHRVTIETPVDVDDGAGGVTRSYATHDAAWAAIEPLEADAAFADNRPGARQRHRITLRWRADLDTAKRLRLGARVFIILAISDVDDRRRRIALLVEEERP